MRNTVSESTELLFSLLSRSLFGKEYTVPADENTWAEAARESIRQAVAAVAFNAIADKNALPQKLYEKWEKYSLGQLCANAENLSSHSYLGRLMKENGIRYCILKGASSAYYYPNFGQRTMGDVDFLVDKNDIEKATAVLVREDFEARSNEHKCHIVFDKSPMRFEMHFDVAGLPEGKAGETIRSYLRDIINNARSVREGSDEFVIPDKFGHGLVSVLHMAHHFRIDGIGLRHLCDFAVFAGSFHGGEFADMFEEKLRTVGLWKFTQTLALASSQKLGLEYHEWMGDDSALAQALISEVILSGNFGVKDENRARSTAFYEAGRERGGSDGARAVHAANKTVYNYFPAAEKAKILLPLGYLYVGARYLLQAIGGKRKFTGYGAAMKASKERIKTVDKFNLFGEGK